MTARTLPDRPRASAHSDPTAEDLDLPTFRDLMKRPEAALIYLSNLPRFQSRAGQDLALYLTCACLGFGRTALVGCRKDLADLLRCTSATAKRAAEELQAGGWLEFQPGPPGIGDSYRPGPALREAWVPMMSSDEAREVLDHMRWFFDDARQR